MLEAHINEVRKRVELVYTTLYRFQTEQESVDDNYIQILSPPGAKNPGVSYTPSA